MTLPTKAEINNECVILLHGLGRSHHSMSKIEKVLKESGYMVWNKSYDTNAKPIKQMSQETIGRGLEYCAQQKAKKIHFVTHSLGGILVRAYLQDVAIDKLGRVVMLAPPNQGSELVDVLQPYRLYAFITGPAGQEMGTQPKSLPNQLKPIDAEIGVIAGNFSSDPWFSAFIPGEDDGKVSVERAKLAEMKDFVVMDAGHTFIMRNDQVIAQIVTFLRRGAFVQKQ